MSVDVPAATFLDLSVSELLEEVASAQPAPGGGSALAVALALAAAVLQMAARASAESWDEARGASAQAGALRDRAAALAVHDAEVYEQALATLGAGGSPDPERRDWTLGVALAKAAEPPLALAGLAVDVAELAAETAARASQQLRPDALGSASLAAAVARGAAELVAVNLTAASADERVVSARALADAAAQAAARAYAD